MPTNIDSNVDLNEEVVSLGKKTSTINLSSIAPGGPNTIQIIDPAVINYLNTNNYLIWGRITEHFERV